MLDLHRLRLLLELHRRGTITAVASAMSFSPSAISQQLATLEREAGVSLLEPVGRRVRLTPQAELLIRHAEVLLTEMERAESTLAGTTNEISGTLRVAAFQTAVLVLVPGALTRLVSQHPRLRIEVTELEPEVALPALGTGEFDLVIAEEFPGQPLALLPDVERSDLLLDELLLVTFRGRQLRGLTQLSDQPFVMEPPDTAARRWATTVCRQAGFEPDVRYTTADLQIHLRLVEKGLAIALLPGLSGARDNTEVRVSRLDGRPSRRIFTAVRPGASQRPAIRAFNQTLRA